MKNGIRHYKSPRCWQHLARGPKGHSLASSQKLKRFQSQPPDVYFSSSSLSPSSFPPLVTPQTESFLDSFPKLSGVRREVLTQHCPLCMHSNSWVQPMKRACFGREGGVGRGDEKLLPCCQGSGRGDFVANMRASSDQGYQTTFVGRVREVIGDKRWTEMGIQRGLFLHISHTESCSQHSPLNH